MKPICWDEKVVEDYRERIIVDPDSPILAFKASRGRYTNLPNQVDYAGRPYLGSWHSEDALTWNVFRSLQKAKSLGIITDELGIGQSRALLLWALAPEIDDINADLQYVTGSLIRKYDGVFQGQMTEPDVIMLGTSGIAVIECKLGEPDKALTHLWEGGLESVEKRLPTYQKETPNLISENVKSGDITHVYQLVRMTFYAVKLGEYFQVEPVLISLSNRRNWNTKINKLGGTPVELWDFFRNEILRDQSPRCDSLHWQDVFELAKSKSINILYKYLSTHPCLSTK